MKNKNANTAGFSLIELIIAMTFITIIIFGVVNLQSSNLAMMNRQNNQIQAHFYANQGVQIVKALGTKNLAQCEKSCILTLSGGNYVLSGGSAGVIKSTPFKRTIKTTSAGLSKAYKVTSIIEWEDATGKHNEEGGGAVKAKMIISK